MLSRQLRIRPLNLLVKFLALFSPSCLLSSKSVNQSCSIGHFPPTRLSIVHKCLLIAHGLIILGLHCIQLPLLLVQLFLGLVQFSCRFL